jgi:KRAB domain-containing zinc finger protein
LLVVTILAFHISGLKKAEHKCPFCNFAYTSVNYVLSHLYRAHTDVDPVVLHNAIAQVTTWYKASATAKLLEQQAEGTLLNPDDAAISALTGQGLDCVDGPLISNHESYDHFPTESSNALMNGVAVMNNIPPKDEDPIQTHSRRTLMTQSYACDKCNAKFKMHSQLETHMKRHRSLTPQPCDLCGMVFFSTENLQQHKHTHLKESLLTCDTCSAQFRDEVQFLEHQKTHNLKHDCVHCGRQYADAQTLTSHLKDHINEGPIRCEKCDLWFADKSTLGQHLQIHGSDQLYQCQFCAYTFTEMAVLRRHTESHLKLEIIGRGRCCFISELA